jgi:hypothetical protein
VGLYCGKKKPFSLGDFHEDFIADLQDLYIKSLCSTVFIFMFRLIVLCDAPAGASLKNVKGNTGCFGCDKCTQEGSYLDGRMTFLGKLCI